MAICNKRILSIIIIISFVFSVLNLQLTMAYAENGIVLYEEDFESGEFTIVDGVNGANNIKKLLKDDQLQWTFEKSDGAAFTGWSDEMVVQGADDSSGVSNTSMVLKSGSTMAKNTILYHNFERAYSEGTITIDMRVKRPEKSTRITIMLYDAAVESYASLPNRVANIILETDSSWRTRVAHAFQYQDESQYGVTAWTSWISSTGWWSFRFIVDLDDQKIKLMRSHTSDPLADWDEINFAAIGNAGSYTMAQSLGAIAFTGGTASSSTGGTLLIDDIKVVYEPSGVTPPVASGVSIIGKPVIDQTLVGTYDSYFDNDGDLEYGSTCQWYTSDDSDFTTNVQMVKTEGIAAGQNSNYIITEDDLGKYIAFSVIPRNQAEEANVGSEVFYYMEEPVRYPQSKPQVSIVSPTEGEYMILENVKFTSNASSDTATITKVEYYIDDNMVGQSTEAPLYPFIWEDATIGSFSLKAKAYNSIGESEESQAVNFTVINIDEPYPLIGTVHKRLSREISGKHFSIGSETLDRDYAVYSNYKEYLNLTGAKLMRLQGGWAKCEKVKGVYDWAWLDESIDHALSVGVTPWVNTCYGNPIYEGGGGTTLGAGLPTSPEALEAWDNWVRAMVTRYKDKVKHWEIWNEADHSSITMSEYVNFFIRTSDIIRSIQPDSKIIGLAGAKTTSSHVRSFLNPLKNAGKIDNLDIITVHGYPSNPDDSSYRTIKSMLPSYSPKLELWNGETGIPHRKGSEGAFSGFNSTELIQQKWILRRMLSARAVDVPINIFCLVDLQYENGTNYKGLLKTDRNTMEVTESKLAFDSYRNVTSIFDDTLNVIPAFGYTADGSLTNLHVTGYEKALTKKQVIAIWDKSSTPGNSLDTTQMTFTFPQGNFEDPVYVDLRDGKVYQITNWIKNEDNSYTFFNVPIYDSPILIADKTTFEFNPIGVSVEGICLYSSDGATGISNTLESETALIAKALASNTGTDYANLALFLALYDNNNKLIGLSMSQPTIINQNAKDVLLTANLELTEEQKQSTTKVKVLVWDINTMYGYKNYYEENFALE